MKKFKIILLLISFLPICLYARKDATESDIYIYGSRELAEAVINYKYHKKESIDIIIAHYRKNPYSLSPDSANCLSDYKSEETKNILLDSLKYKANILIHDAVMRAYLDTLDNPKEAIKLLGEWDSRFDGIILYRLMPAKLPHKSKIVPLDEDTIAIFKDYVTRKYRGYRCGIYEGLMKDKSASYLAEKCEIILLGVGANKYPPEIRTDFTPFKPNDDPDPYQAWKHKDFELGFAAYALTNLKGQSIENLKKFTPSEYGLEYAVVIIARANLGDREVKEDLKKVISDMEISSYLRYNALEVLEKMLEENDIPFLEKIRDSDPFQLILTDMNKQDLEMFELPTKDRPYPLRELADEILNKRNNKQK